MYPRGDAVRYMSAPAGIFTARPADSHGHRPQKHLDLRKHAKRVAGAEAMYRADLDDTAAGLPAPRQRVEPARVPRMPGPPGMVGEAAIIGQQFRLTAALADVPIVSSGFCRQGL
jgi:hypothetical protein